MPAFFRKLTFFSFIACLLFGCSEPPNTLQSVLDKGELVVLTRIDSTTYSNNKNGEKGFEYDLATLFADTLGVRVRFIVPEQFHHILSLTTRHEADFAAAGLSVTPQRENLLHFTPPYYSVTQQVIYHYRTRRPSNLKALTGSFFEVLAGTSHAENLRNLKKNNPSLTWNEAYNTNIPSLIKLVNDGLLDYTVADSNQFQMLRGQFPQLNVAFDISDPEQIAWAFPISDDHSLYDKAVTFLGNIKASGRLEQLRDKHFGYSGNLNYVGICTFRRHAQSRLPTLRDFFQHASEKYALDWKLIAAVAYQESHWNQHAISPTGVRGIMMLTNATAKQMKIANRLDPEQSIDGGAHYLATRIKKIPERIAEPDRTWMALASYNIGLGHLEDARVLTQQQGGDPDKWIDIKQRLPLLAKRKWYKKTKHGYARGNEPVVYVENVRHYVELLTQLEPKDASLENDFDINDTLNIQLPAL